MPKIVKNWQGTYEWPICIFEQAKTEKNEDSTDYSKNIQNFKEEKPYKCHKV